MVAKLLDKERSAMESQIRTRIQNADRNISEYSAIYTEILNSNLEAKKKDELLSILKKSAFLKSIDLSNWIVPRPLRLPKVKDVTVITDPTAMSFLTTVPEASQVDINEYSYIQQQIDIVKSHFPFLKLIVLKDGSEVESYNSTLVCCDEISTDYINSYFSDHNHKFIGCKSFSEGTPNTTGSYLFLLLLPQSQQINKTIIQKIKGISGVKFLDFEAFARKDLYWLSGYYFNQEMDKYLEIKYDLPLVNLNLSIDQEKIIRKAVGSPTGFLTYKVLTGGYTGATVLEVSSVGNIHARKKFVLKIDIKGREWQSINQEFINFQQHVENIAVSGATHSPQKFECGELEAIKYPFASLNSVGDSVSLGSFLKSDDTSNEKLKSVITQIFDHELMVSWNKTFSLKHQSLFLSFEKLDYTIRDFKRVMDFQRKFGYEKFFDLDKLTAYFEASQNVVYCTAHGDFHVENIRVDSTESGNQIYFIDFGSTGLYPMGVDFAALECSIRFRVLDSAFSIKDLDAADDQYFSFFAEIFDSKTDDISKVNYTISLIRQAYFNRFPAAHKPLAESQYFKCLFSVCSWLMNKPNLNRPYIWKILERIYTEKFQLD